MYLKPGDPVLLRTGPNEQLEGEVVTATYGDLFSDDWQVQAVITEGGHPNFGQLGLFMNKEVSLRKESA